MSSVRRFFGRCCTLCMHKDTTLISSFLSSFLFFSSFSSWFFMHYFFFESPREIVSIKKNTRNDFYVHDPVALNLVWCFLIDFRRFSPNFFSSKFVYTWMDRKMFNSQVSLIAFNLLNEPENLLLLLLLLLVYLYVFLDEKYWEKCVHIENQTMKEERWRFLKNIIIHVCVRMCTLEKYCYYFVSKVSKYVGWWKMTNKREEGVYEWFCV